MFLGIRNPWGQVTSIDLRELSVWRLGLMAVRAPQDAADLPPRWLAVVVSYVTSAGVAHAPVAALFLKDTTDEAKQIADVGFPKADRNANKDRMREAAKILVNSMRQADADDVNQKLGLLVDVYFDFLEATFMPRLNRLADVVALPRGEFEGWQYGLTQTRFEPWMQSRASLAIPYASGTIGAPPPSGGGHGMPPPPGSDAGNHPPAPLAPLPSAKRPSREQQRKSGKGSALPPPPQTTEDLTPPKPPGEPEPAEEMVGFASDPGGGPTANGEPEELKPG